MLVLLSWLLSVFFSLVLSLWGRMAAVVVTITVAFTTLPIFWSSIIIFSFCYSKNEKRKKKKVAIFFFISSPSTPTSKMVMKQMALPSICLHRISLTSCNLFFLWVWCTQNGHACCWLLPILLSDSLCLTSWDPPVGLTPLLCRHLCFSSTTLCALCANALLLWQSLNLEFFSSCFLVGCRIGLQLSSCLL